MATKKRELPVRVAMYISKDNLQVYEDLKEVVRATGFSMSDVAYFAFVTGFYQMKEGILKMDGKPSKIKNKRFAKN